MLTPAVLFSHVSPNPGKIFVHPDEDNDNNNDLVMIVISSLSPGVHAGEVWAGAVHPEAGHPHHGPGAPQLGGQHGAPGVTVARVPGPVPRTNLC